MLAFSWTTKTQLKDFSFSLLTFKQSHLLNFLILFDHFDRKRKNIYSLSKWGVFGKPGLQERFLSHHVWKFNDAVSPRYRWGSSMSETWCKFTGFLRKITAISRWNHKSQPCTRKILVNCDKSCIKNCMCQVLEWFYFTREIGSRILRAIMH